MNLSLALKCICMKCIPYPNNVSSYGLPGVNGVKGSIYQASFQCDFWNYLRISQEPLSLTAKLINFAHWLLWLEFWETVCISLLNIWFGTLVLWPLLCIHRVHSYGQCGKSMGRSIAGYDTLVYCSPSCIFTF